MIHYTEILFRLVSNLIDLKNKKIKNISIFLNINTKNFFE